ncbi:MAG: hypothetical protein WDZ35_00965 [Crocinitomicaceae bacterium]
MKFQALFLILFICFSANSQVYGDIFIDKRKITKDIDYTIPYSKTGKLVFDIAVDLDGNVTSCILNKEKSTITATPAMMKARNKIVQHLKFEFGLQFPKFHRGYVQINTVPNKEKEKNNSFQPPTD